jgi:hypothetical protein
MTSSSVNAALVKRTFVEIRDGTSNTILLGHIYVAVGDYPVTAPSFSTNLPIFVGGSLATARTGDGIESVDAGNGRRNETQGCCCFGIYPFADCGESLLQCSVRGRGGLIYPKCCR